MKKNRFISILLSFSVLLSMVCFTSVAVYAATGTAPQKGTGTSADPYIIDEPLELVWLSENYSANIGCYFLQTTNIDMSSVTDFTPIGNGTTSAWGNEFSGQYDGNGFQISHLTISSDLGYVGLFQYVSGTVKNLTLNAASITSTGSTYSYVSLGGIAGLLNGGTISMCEVNGSLSINSVSSSASLAGICGQCSGSAKVTNCYSTATLTNSNTYGSVGGIAGYTVYAGLSVDHCYFAGAIIGGIYAKGAIIGNDYLGTFTKNVYLDSTSSFGIGYSKTDTGCTRATVASMKTTAPYLAQGWDFTTVWQMDAATGYPTFITAPGIPTNVKAQPGNNQITVSWNAADYASEYNIYYGTASGVYGTPVKVSGTSGTIPGLTNMTKYYICVKALHGLVEGTGSSEVSCIPHVIISDLKASGGVSGVDITFSAPTGASAVELLQSVNGSAYSAVTGVSLTSTSTGANLTGLAVGVYTYKLQLTFAGSNEYSNESTASVGGNYTQYADDFATSYYADDNRFYVGCYDGTVDNAALRFDLTGSTGTVKNAYLCICQIEYPQWSYGNAVFDLYGRLDNTWVTTLPADQIPPSNSVLIQSGVAGFTLGSYKQMTVTDYVKNMFASGNKNVSFYLAGKLTSAVAQDDANFYSPASAKNKPYIVIEFAKDNADLSGIKIDGTSLSGFSDSTFTYNYTAPHDSNLSALSFTSTLEDSSATQSSWTYNTVGHSWSVTVTAPDGTTQKTYTVNVSAAAMSSDATLSSISIGGTALSGFSSSKLDYFADVPHGTVASALNLTSVVHDHHGVQGSWTYDAAGHKWSVTVTSEDGTATMTYTVTINILPSTDATLKSINVNGTDIPSFSPATLIYTVDVPHGTQVTPSSFVSVTNDDGAQQMAWTFDPFTGKWTARVTAEDGITELFYSVIINVLPSSDAKLTGIKIDGMDLGGFSASNYGYSYNVSHGTNMSALALTSTFSDHMATGSWSYDPATQEWSIKVTAEDKATTLTYTVTINELPSTDATLLGIKVDGTSIAGFLSYMYGYTYDVAHGTDMSALALTSTFSDANATGSWSFDPATKKWSITVTAEDKATILTYTVSINELPSTDASLAGIKIDGTDIVGFSSSTYSYTHNVVHGTDMAKLALTGTFADHMATGSWSYDAATHAWSITVTAENKATMLTYSVTINELPSTDATLSGIKIDGTDLGGFSSANHSYTYDVVHGTDMSKLSITSTFADHMATGSWIYDAAAHAWNIKVTAEDLTTTLTYTVAINELPSTDAALLGIKVDGTSISGFLSSMYDYSYDVVHGTDIASLALTATFSDHKATGSWVYDATTKKWSIAVTAEDKSTKLTYTVTINELPSTDATLSGIKIGGTGLVGFSSSTYDYACDVVHGTDISTLVLTGTVSDHMAVQGSWSYDAATKKWSITVTAEDTKTTRTYTVTINELPSTDATLKSLTIGGKILNGFTPSQLHYTYAVISGTDASAFVLGSECNDHMATQGAWVYDANKKIWSVTVTAEDTSKTNTYEVAVTEFFNQPAGVLGDYRTNSLLYQTHVQDIGWQGNVQNGVTSGTSGQSKRMEAIRIKLSDLAGGIEYCTHVQDIGWMNWVADGALSGTTGQSKRMEAIKIRLTGEAAEKYDVYYRVHSQNFGWLDWAKNGESSGTAGYSYRMEAIQIVLVAKGDPAPGATAKSFVQAVTAQK